MSVFLPDPIHWVILGLVPEMKENQQTDQHFPNIYNIQNTQN